MRKKLVFSVSSYISGMHVAGTEWLLMMLWNSCTGAVKLGSTQSEPQMYLFTITGG